MHLDFFIGLELERMLEQQIRVIVYINYRSVILMVNKCFVPFPKLETERLILR